MPVLPVRDAPLRFSPPGWSIHQSVQCQVDIAIPYAGACFAAGSGREDGKDYTKDKSRFGTVTLYWWKYKPCISLPFRDLCHGFDPLIFFVSVKTWFLLDRPLNFSLFGKQSWKKMFALGWNSQLKGCPRENKLSSTTMRCVDWTWFWYGSCTVILQTCCCSLLPRF